MEYLQHEVLRDSTILPRYNELLKEVPQNYYRQAGSVITIPVVVHVVYNTTVQNIALSQIQSAISVLNEDYRRFNSDASNTFNYSTYGTYPVDCEIEFCLVAVTRTYTTFPSFGLDASAWNGIGDIANVKNVAPGYGQGYLNIWSCDIQGSLYGYAVFPNTAPAQYEGVTVDYAYFGRTGVADPNYAGRVVTHEVGHWLGLFHIAGNNQSQLIWDPNYQIYVYQCGDDFVSDTWAQHQQNSGCNWLTTNCTGSMFYPYNYNGMNQNYMDYSTGSCLNFFSSGQKQRIWYHINAYRYYLVNAPISCTTGMLDNTDFSTSNLWYDNLNNEIIIEPDYGFEGNTTIIITDLMGRDIFESKTFLSQVEKNRIVLFQDLASGIYVASVVCDDKRFSKRIVVSR
ncbi:MAG: zinc-dependent metalloprotease [Bacteroidia bacterium]